MKNQVRHSHFLSLLLRAGLILSLLVCGGPVAPVRAASTLTVNSNADSGAGTLRQAIADATAGDTINFDSSLSGATITLASQLVLSKNVTIDGSALAVPIIISGNDAVRVFYISSGVSAELNSLTVDNGRSGSAAGGGIYNTNGTLTITNSTITGNSAPGYSGGGIYTSGTLTLTNSTCSFNSTGSGGCLNGSGVITITNSAISDNFARYNGGGIMLSSGMLTMTNSAVVGNSAGNEGGGINISGTTATITNSTISNNTARLEGGGIRTGSNSTIIKDCTFSGNSSGNRGGGIYKSLDVGTFAITNSTFMNNLAYYGGAIASPVGTNSTVTNATFVNNMSSYAGDNFSTNNNQGFLLANSILYNGNCSNENSQPAIIDGGNNLDNGTYCGFSSSTKGSLNNTNPRLGALTGSPAYYPLKANSPAINAVTYNAPNNCPATDQRGMARVGACDIGAYEYVALAPEIDVLGKGLSIPSGSNTPSTANGTDFGPVTLATSVSQTFTIQNTGTAALTLSGASKVAIGGTDAADFSVTADPTSPVAATSGSTTFIVRFNPSTAGLKSATISIDNNDSNENPYTFTIQGTGNAVNNPTAYKLFLPLILR